MGRFVRIGTNPCGQISEGASEWKQHGDVDVANDLRGVIEVTSFIFLAERTFLLLHTPRIRCVKVCEGPPR